MAISAILSALHMLALAPGLGAVVVRGQAFARPIDTDGWKRLLAADTAWGIAAALWIVTGIARVFWGGKAVEFYTHNGLFWVKVVLFGLVFALEIWPMVTLIRARIALRRHGTFELQARSAL